jgi:FixJ family two-component response regulator
LDPLIHIIDKSSTYSKIVESCLRGLGYTNFHTYANSSDWLDHGTQPDIVILDHSLGENQVTGLELLRAFNKCYTSTRFVFLSSDTSIDVALSAIKSGASDYILKNQYGLEKLVRHIDYLTRKNAQKRKMNFYYWFLLITIGVLCLTLVTGIFLYSLS